MHVFIPTVTDGGVISEELISCSAIKVGITRNGCGLSCSMLMHANFPQSLSLIVSELQFSFDQCLSRVSLLSTGL